MAFALLGFRLVWDYLFKFLHFGMGMSTLCLSPSVFLEEVTCFLGSQQEPQWAMMASLGRDGEQECWRTGTGTGEEQGGERSLTCSH